MVISVDERRQNDETKAEAESWGRDQGQGRPYVDISESEHMATMTTIQLNHIFVMNVAMIQSQNRYNQYYLALDSTFSRPS